MKLSARNTEGYKSQQKEQKSDDLIDQIKKLQKSFNSIILNHKLGTQELVFITSIDPHFQGISDHDSNKKYQLRLDTLMKGIKKRLPYLAMSQHTLQSNSNFEHHLQVQLILQEKSILIDTQRVVVFDQSIENLEQLPTHKYLIRVMNLFSQQITLNIVLKVKQNQVSALFQDNSNPFEEAEVTLRQRNEFVSNQTLTDFPSAQIFLYKNPQSSISHENMIRVNYSSAEKTTNSVVQLYSEKRQCNAEGRTHFTMNKQLMPYEVSVRGANIKHVVQILDDMNSKELLINVERIDVTTCGIVVKGRDGFMSDAVVKISLGSEFKEFETLQYDEKKQVYSILVKINKTCFIQVEKDGYYPQSKTIHTTGKQQIEFKMVEHIDGLLTVRTLNLFDNTPVLGTEIYMDNEGYGSENDGVIKIRAPMSSRVNLKVRKSGFLNIEYAVDMGSSVAGKVVDLQMLPDYCTLINQFHVIIFIPKACKINYDLVLSGVDENKVSIKKYNYTTGLMVNYGIPISSVDQNKKNRNIYELIGTNQFERQTLISQQSQTFSTKTKSINDSFASSKLIKYNAEEGVRVMVTYGQVMIDQFIIQESYLRNYSQSFGVLDLNKRTFVRNNSTLQTLTSYRNLQNLPSKIRKESISQSCLITKNILQLISNTE